MAERSQLYAQHFTPSDVERAAALVAELRAAPSKATRPTPALDAARAGQKTYFTGRPCSRGHIAERLVINQSCVECVRENGRRHKARVRAAQKIPKADLAGGHSSGKTNE